MLHSERKSSSESRILIARVPGSILSINTFLQLIDNFAKQNDVTCSHSISSMMAEFVDNLANAFKNADYTENAYLESPALGIFCHEAI